MKLIVGILHAEYGSPNHANKQDPVDELIFIILSLMTTHHSFNRVYNRLKSEVTDWSLIRGLETNELREIIKEGGLSDQKAKVIKGIAERLYTDFGAVTLVPLESMSNDDAERYLTSLPGVGIKTAKCVLMYSLNRAVLPVDTHVKRVASRLGLLPQNISLQFLHDKLEGVIPPEYRYSFHVNALCHGRAVCQAIRPRCPVCKLVDVCPYPEKKKA